MTSTLDTEILDAFKRLNFKPRDNQVESIGRVLQAFDKSDDVVLCAPTGSGKSIIGAVTADVLAARAGLRINASIILMHNNVLVGQYHDSFKNNPLFSQLKGAGQYPCITLTKETGEEFTAEDCALQALGKMKVDTSPCQRCEYYKAKEKRNSVKHLITNFSYYFVDRMYADILDPRLITVWDEAHTINDIFTEHNAIYVSPARLKKMAEEVSETIQPTDPRIYNTIRKMQRDLESGKINENNYFEVLPDLHHVYTELADMCENRMQATTHDFKRYMRYKRLNKKYFGLGCKIDDLANYGYEHVAQLTGEQELSIKPIFVGPMFNSSLRGSPKNLFMSATITDWFMRDTLGLKNVEFVQLEPSFPPENKRFVFYKQMSLNYQAMQSSVTLKKLVDNAKDICAKHTELDERGIILTPSFKLAEEMAKGMKGIKNLRVFQHFQGEKLIDLLQTFKNYKGGAAVLISPSLFEGIDLPGDLCRYQILVKAPFASLGDKRVKTIMEKYPKIYSLMTLKKIVQGAGRGVRSSSDHAVTYALDANIGRLFNDPQLNIWKPEFQTEFKQIL